ncbi:MAG: helix-turn-helix domain-containing protein [Opitutales bacterium]
MRSFAVHLGTVSNRLLMERSSREPPPVTRTKAWIARHYGDPVTLDDVAGAVHASSFHFSRLFRKATGLTFSEYLARYRIEQAKQLLLDRNRRVSEVAFAVGFQSLTPFNRAFRRYAGQSPSAWRAGDGSRG